MPQHTTTRCNTLRHAATHYTPHCITPHHTATHRNTSQHTASHCNTLQHTVTHRSTEARGQIVVEVAVFDERRGAAPFAAEFHHVAVFYVVVIDSSKFVVSEFSLP